jgi:flagellin
MLSINSNPLASQLANQLNSLTQDIQKSAQRIATGKRITTAADDPAAVGILSTLKSDFASYASVNSNLSSGLSLLEVGASSLQNQQGILQQMKQLATQASSDLISDDQRTALQKTFKQLQSQLDDAVNKSSIFGNNLTGVDSADVTIQSGINSGQTTTLTAVKSDAATLKVDDATIDLTDSTKAKAAMTAIATAVGKVAGNQAVVGAQQNSMKVQMDNAKSVQLNLENAISRIEDTDIAAETSKLQQLQAKQQLSVQVMGIVNQFPSYALGLLK